LAWLGAAAAFTALTAATFAGFMATASAVLAGAFAAEVAASNSSCKLRSVAPSFVSTSSTARACRANSLVPPAGERCATWRGHDFSIEPPRSGALITSTGSGGCWWSCVSWSTTATPQS
jgi:hypothetical protein